MIIKCKNCNTNYVIADNSIGPNGKNVKCAKCSHKWVETLPISSENVIDKPLAETLVNEKLASNISSMVADIQTPNTSIAISTIIPKVQKTKIDKFLFYFPILIGALIFSALGELYSDILEDHFPQITIFNKISYIEDLKDIEVSAAQITNKIDGDSKFEVSCKISNHANETKKISYVKAKIYDENNNLLISYFLEQDLLLDSNEIKDIKKELPNLPDKANYILVTANNFNI